MGKAILIVDDCATTRKLIALYLKPSGHRVIQAENGLEALEKLAKGPVELVITDMNMPSMDGLELTRSLKQDEALKDIPVLMLTTEVSDKERRSGLEAGAAAYIIKPVAQEVLTAEVERLLAAAGSATGRR